MDADVLAAWNPTEPIDTMEKFIQEINKFTEPRGTYRNRYIFRGVADEHWTLSPSLARKKCAWIDDDKLMLLEMTSTKYFEQKIRLYLDQKYIPKTAEGYWQMMQHHGAPTRIMDWSISAFTALYFAVSDKPSPVCKKCSPNAPEPNAVVWAIDPAVYQARVFQADSNGMAGLPLKFHPELKNLFPQVAYSPILPEAKNVAQKAERSNEPPPIMFIDCDMPDQRMAAQRGCFSMATEIQTDHGEAIGRHFAMHKPEFEYCKKFVIAGSARSEMLRALWRMNITGETIYCGLDALGRSLNELTDLIRPDESHIYTPETNGNISVHRKVGPKPPRDSES